MNALYKEAKVQSPPLQKPSVDVKIPSTSSDNLETPLGIKEDQNTTNFTPSGNKTINNFNTFAYHMTLMGKRSRQNMIYRLIVFIH